MLTDALSKQPFFAQTYFIFNFSIFYIFGFDLISFYQKKVVVQNK